jgi:NADH-quinone oxidoreductase subunit A
MQTAAFPIFLYTTCLLGLAAALLVLGNLLNPRRPGRVKEMPYESGMDPIHDTRRRFDVRFHLLAIAFLVFDVELLFLYPWAVAISPAGPTSVPGPAQVSATGLASPATVAVRAAGGAASGRVQDGVEGPRSIFLAGMVFLAVLALGYIYDWRKGVFRWR